VAKQQLYIQREGTVAGPYDLVQMAGLLRKNIISRETQTRLEGEDAWMPLSWQPQFAVIRELSPDATSMHLEELNEEAMNRRSPIPLPSRELLMQLAAGAAGCLLVAALAFLFAWLNTAVGTALLYAGGGIALAAQVMIIFKMIDEDYWKLFLTILIPLYDIYFFICNIDRYYKLLAVKYVGVSIALGATLGLGMHH
jgi:GYF domain 2